MTTHTTKSTTFEISIPEGVFVISVKIEAIKDDGYFDSFPFEERTYKITDMIEIDEDGKEFGINENHPHFQAIDNKVYGLCMSEELEYEN